MLSPWEASYAEALVWGIEPSGDLCVPRILNELRRLGHKPEQVMSRDEALAKARLAYAERVYL